MINFINFTSTFVVLNLVIGDYPLSFKMAVNYETVLIRNQGYNSICFYLISLSENIMIETY